jgi:hypothetical protein
MLVQENQHQQTAVFHLFEMMIWLYFRSAFKPSAIEEILYIPLEYRKSNNVISDGDLNVQGKRNPISFPVDMGNGVEPNFVISRYRQRLGK